MNRFIATFTTGVLTSVASIAAPYSMSVTVRDAITAETLTGASCSIYSASDTIKPLFTTMTDVDGKVFSELPKAGEYLLKISMMGQNTERRAFTVSAENPTADLGTIALQPSSDQLGEIEVVGRRPVIEASGDKITYNLNEDPSSSTNTVLEMLRKVPMVTVDAQDNILINGQSNFKIYVNGKEDPMLSQNASTVLKSLPAVAIKKIEVILEPGAKYDAEGVAGILNIITETQSSTDGDMATITLGMGNRNADASLYGVTKHNKVTASANLSYYANTFNDPAKGSIERETFDVENPTSIIQKVSMDQKTSFINGNAQLSWEPNENNLFTLNASAYGGWSTNKYNSLSTTTDLAGNLLLETDQRLKADWVWNSLTVNTAYQHNFRKEGHNMVLSYQYVHGWDKNKSYTTTLNSTEVDFIPCMNEYTNSPTNEHTIQFDYTNPFASYFTLEAGAKGILRRNYSDSYTKTGPTWSDLQLTENNTVDLSQHQDVVAGYASYSGSFNKFSLRAGLRYEYTYLGVKFHTPGYDNFSSYLRDWVPNASLSYSITPAQNLYASYQQRIKRPSVSELNPHKTEYMTGIIMMGNPNLTSEKSHTLALSYSNFAGKLGMQFRTFYNFANNCISQYSYESDGALITTNNNIGNYKQWGFSAFIKYQINGLMDFSINGSVQYTDWCFKAENMENHGWNGNMNINYNYTMPWRMKLNAYGGFSTRRYTLQGTTSGWNYHGISIVKSFLKEDRLKITLSGSNFLAPHSTFYMKSSGSNFHNTMKMRMPTWSVDLSVAVTIGKLNSSVRKTTKQIENDDVNQGKSGGGMGM